MAGKRTSSSVIAIAHQESRLRAVRLEKRGTGFELVWTKSGDVGRMSLPTFAAACSLAAGSEAEPCADKEAAKVVGFDSAGMVFYRIAVPPVKKDELGAVVKMQAESRLPLPPDQMELAWRAGEAHDGQVMVTVAGAKTEQLRGFADNVRDFDPSKILLACEGIVKAWRMFFSGTDELSVVVSCGQMSTPVCLADHGKLVNAVALDVGLEDFYHAHDATEVTQTGERFAQDMRSVLALFGFGESPGVAVFVLSDGSRMVTDMVSCLESAGLNATAALPEVEKLRTAGPLGASDVYDYRVPIGLASMVLDGDADELNVFRRVYKAAAEKPKKHWFHSLRITGAIAVVMAILLVGLLYGADVITSRRLTRLTAGEDFEQLVKRANMVRTVARERQKTDVLGLLREINGIESDGILLNGVHFVRGRQAREVRIEGQADKVEQLYKFEKTLQDMSTVRNVTEESAVLDKKSKKTIFRIKFNYGSYAKTARLRESERPRSYDWKTKPER